MVGGSSIQQLLKQKAEHGTGGAGRCERGLPGLHLCYTDCRALQVWEGKKAAKGMRAVGYGSRTGWGRGRDAR